MKIQQLSLFLENQPGQIVKPCRLLAGEGINIRTLSVADTKQFGILRMIVSDWQRAAQLLKDAGYVVNVTEVVAIEVPDKPGGLASLLQVLENSPVNVEYMYSFPSGRRETAVMIFRFDQPDAAIKLLQSAGISVVSSVEVYNRAEQ
ncbi:MAG: ACT domain-containing protein [Bryobacteraceae bacterium]